MIFDTLRLESKADSVDICTHINNKTVQYKYKNSACVCVYITHSCKWCVITWGCMCVVVCTCEPVLGQDRWALEVRLSLPNLVEEWSVKLGLQLLVAVSLHNLSYFLFPPHVRGVVQVTLQTFSPAHVDDSLADEKSWERGKNTRVQQLEWVKSVD